MSDQIDEKLEDLFELVFKYCNLAPVKDLLRRYKKADETPPEKRDDIRISGENAHSIITENLRAAVSRKAIPESDVFSLLQEAEENGRQHIFLFQPKSKASLSDPEGIAKVLLGANWNRPGKYPRLQLQPNGYCWSDFRVLGAKGWVAKLYGHSTFEEEVDQKVEKGERVRWVKLATKDIRTVSLARWRPQIGIFELRVADSGAKILLQEIVKQLRPAIDVTKLCVPWDLSPIRHEILIARKDNADLYECGDWLALDSESYALQGSPHTQDPEEKVQLSEATRKVVDQIADSTEHEKRKLVVHWQPSETNGNKRLRTILGTPANTHEVIISAQATSQAVDDVINQLLDFAG